MNAYQPVLDPACGGRMFWFDKTMFGECFRVLKEHGVLILKWNETQIPVSQILKLTTRKPLFGNKQPNRTGTHWIVFMKEIDNDRRI